MEEIWVPAKYYTKQGKYYDFTGKYEVSNLGNIRTLNYKLKKGDIEIMTQGLNGNYLGLTLQYAPGQSVYCFSHRLVAASFPTICGGYFLKAEINHKDENPLNNVADNLEWCSSKYNNRYGTRLKRALEAKKINGKRNIPVMMYDMNGLFLCEWASATIAAEVLFKNPKKAGHISTCCSGKRASAFHYIWRYKSQ